MTTTALSKELRDAANRLQVADHIPECVLCERAADALDQLSELMREQDELLNRCAAALDWCSGASDFQQNGIAALGWEKLCRPLIGKLKALAE